MAHWPSSSRRLLSGVSRKTCATICSLCRRATKRGSHSCNTQWIPAIPLTKDLTLVETSALPIDGLESENDYILRIKCSGYGAASANCTAMADTLCRN